ncbi:MAG: protein translocase subunit SecF [Ruminococcaceae bacterium]|nr:protein translocase subunit SecF [Oscillospiraceae bacterium]
MLKIVQYKKIYVGIALVLVIASIASLLIQGFALDTDFAGGTAVTYTVNQKVSKEEVEALVKDAFGKSGVIRITEGKDNTSVIDIEVGHDQSLSDDKNMEKANAAVEKLNYEIANKWGKLSIIVDENGVAIPTGAAEETTETTEAAENAEAAEATGEEAVETTEPTVESDVTEEAVTEEAVEATTEETAVEGATKKASELTEEQAKKNVITYGDYAYFVEGVSKSELNVVSSATARNLASSAIFMSLLAAVGILIYVAFRFDFTSGVCAVVALAHDIIVLCGIYSVLRIKIDTNFIAALLTVLGYSINNTIVIFDRIRENTRRAKKETYAEIANLSINSTIKRSINTTITTLLTIGMVYILGVESIKIFALPIIIGIFVGTYSSIFVSGSIWATWKDMAVKNKKKQ